MRILVPSQTGRGRRVIALQEDSYLLAPERRSIVHRLQRLGPQRDKGFTHGHRIGGGHTYFALLRTNTGQPEPVSPRTYGRASDAGRSACVAGVDLSG
jgi:hypothetical protein